MKIRSLSFLFFFCAPFFLLAQKVRLDNNFLFKDGAWRSFGEFKKNAPSIPKERVLQAEHWLDPDGNVLYVAAPGKQGAWLRDSIWGLSIDGVAYFRARREEADTSAMFVKVHVVGKLCYFYYETIELHTVPMRVYHPVSGVLITQRDIVNRDRVMCQKLMRFDTGETADFNVKNFAAWIADDPRLTATVKDLKKGDAEDKLFKTLLIYNDRNAVFLE